MLAVIYVLTLPLALPDLVRESPATSVFRLQQSQSSLICFLSLWAECSFPRVSHKWAHSQFALLCRLLLPRFSKYIVITMCNVPILFHCYVVLNYKYSSLFTNQLKGKVVSKVWQLRIKLLYKSVRKFLCKSKLWFTRLHTLEWSDWV